MHHRSVKFRTWRGHTDAFAVPTLWRRNVSGIRIKFLCFAIVGEGLTLLHAVDNYGAKFRGHLTDLQQVRCWLSAPREIDLGLGQSDVAESQSTLEPPTLTAVQDWNVRGEMMRANRVDEASRGSFKVVERSRNCQPFSKTVPSNQNSVTHKTW